jgi:putative ABC transport system permease protein
MWFYVSGILRPAPLTPEIDSEVLVGFSATEKYPGSNGHATEIYVKVEPTSQTAAVGTALAATADPEAPNEVDVSQPSAALVAQLDAPAAMNGLFLGLGAVALLVGAVGVANIMVISVLECRSEIGLGRALGATKGHIRTQFLTEAVLLALLGGGAGIVLGTIRTAVYASSKHYGLVIPRLRGVAALALRSSSGPSLGSGRRSGPSVCHRPKHCGPFDLEPATPWGTVL